MAGVPEPGLISMGHKGTLLGEGEGLKTPTVGDPLAKAFVGSSPTPRTIHNPTEPYVQYLLSNKKVKMSTIERKVTALKTLVNNGANLNKPTHIHPHTYIYTQSHTPTQNTGAFQESLLVCSFPFSLL